MAFIGPEKALECLVLLKENLSTIQMQLFSPKITGEMRVSHSEHWDYTGCSTAGYAHQEISLKTARLAERKNSLHIKLYLPLLDNCFGKQLPIIKLKEVCR